MATYAPMTIKVGKTITVTPHPVDGENPPQPAPLDGGIVFTDDNAGVLQYVPPINNIPETLVGLKPGMVIVTATDTSVGQPIVETFQITVTQNPAITFGFVFGIAP